MLYAGRRVVPKISRLGFRPGYLPENRSIVNAETVTFGILTLWQGIRRRFNKRQLMEALLIGVAFAAYFAVRGAVVQRPEAAFAHALDIIQLQRDAGFFWEDDWQNWIRDNLFAVQTMNIIYFWLHFPLIIAFGIYLYIKARRKFTLMRDALLASGAISLIVYWAYPVAPPRELPRLAAELGQTLAPDVAGFVDTMQVHLGYAYQSQSTAAFVNPYAAMPSLHFGWDLLLGFGIIWAFWGGRWMWLALPIGIALPTMQVFSITMTANHFLLDAAAGGVVSLAGLLVAVGLQRWGYPRLGRLVRKLPWKTVRALAAPSEDREMADQGVGRGQSFNA